jgi:hypothetical protein
MKKAEMLREASGSGWKKLRCCGRHPGRDEKNEGAAGGIRVGMKKIEVLREASGLRSPEPSDGLVSSGVVVPQKCREKKASGLRAHENTGCPEAKKCRAALPKEEKEARRCFLSLPKLRLQAGRFIIHN